MPRNITTAAILLLSSTASGFMPAFDDLSARTAAAFHAIQEDFQRSLLAAQLANNSNDYGPAEENPTLIATKQRTLEAKEKAAQAKERAKKAAEAAMVAKEKAQAKIRERAAAAASEVVEEDKSGDDVAPSEPVVAAQVEEPPPSTTASTSTAIVPINESTTQFTAGALGAAAGLLLGGGPFLAIFLSATANYLSRKDDTPSTPEEVASPKRIVDKAAQTALLIYNYVAQFEYENQFFDGTVKAIEGAVDKAKQKEDKTAETITALESALSDVGKNIEQLNDEYDLVGGAGTVLNSVGDLVEDSVDKVIDLNGQYKLTERVGGVVKGAVAKVIEKKE